MTQEDKAARFDMLTREGDKVQRDLSILQSANAGINTTSKEYDKKLNEYRNHLAYLEVEMRKLFQNG